MGGYKSSKWLKVETNSDGNPDFICFDIREYGQNVGFFAEMLYTLMRLYFAEQRGLISVVTWGKNHLYYEEGKEDVNNVFLYYFEQVSDLERPEDAHFVIESRDYHIGEMQDYFDTHGYDTSELYISELSNVYRKYIRYNDNTRVFLEKEYYELLGNKKTLAVHFRGTDYRRQYDNHPIFVSIEKEIEQVRNLLRTKAYEQIFLATDEQRAIELFKSEFGETLKVYEDVYRSSGGNESVAYSKSNRNEHHYRLGLEVIRDQYTLTRCQGLVCGVSNLTICARMARNAWYEPYEDLVVLDNGINRNNKRFSQAKH